MAKWSTKFAEAFCTCCKHQPKEQIGKDGYKRDQELTSPYGDNNPPLSMCETHTPFEEQMGMSEVKDKDYSC